MATVAQNTSKALPALHEKSQDQEAAGPDLLLLSILWIVIYSPFEAVYFFIPDLYLNDSYLIIIPTLLWNTTIPATIPKNTWSTHFDFKHPFNDRNNTSPTVIRSWFDKFWFDGKMI